MVTKRIKTMTSYPTNLTESPYSLQYSRAMTYIDIADDIKVSAMERFNQL